MKEIEHRFLLRSFPAEVEERAHTIVRLQNGYLSTETIQERFTCRLYLRHPEFELGTRLYRRTVKIGYGLERYEFVDAVDEALWKRMWMLTKRNWVVKTRCRLEEGDVTWEVDQFGNRELYLAEVEVPTVDTEVTVPDWLQPYIIREVTDEKEFEGRALAR